MELVIDEKKIRTLPHEGQMLPRASDLIESLINVKNGRQTWNAVKKRLPEITNHVVVGKSQGGKAEYLKSKGFGLLISDLKVQKGKGHDKLKEIRNAAMDIAGRYYTGDPTLVHEVIDKIENADDLERIANRAKVKLTNKLLTDAIRESNGTGWIYSQINDQNNLTVTGQKAKEIVATRAPEEAKKPQTRDYFTMEELVNMQFLEMQEQRSLKKHKAEGNTEIKTVCNNIITAFNKMNDM